MKERKQKTLAKKLFVAMLSVMMAVTFIPTSLFVFAAEPDVTSAEAQDEIVQDDVQKEDVQDDVQTEEEVQTEPTEATEATEATEVVKEEPVKETEATQPKDAEQKEEAKDDEPKEMPAKHFTKDLDGVVVEVDTPKGTFDQKVDLVVAPINKGSMEYMASKFFLKKNGQDFDGMLAYDIHFENSNGKEVEPSKTVTVDLTVEKEALEGIDPETFDVDSVQVSHIGEKAVDVVADVADETKGTVDVAVEEEAIKSIKASFKTKNFSPYVIYWGDDNQFSATIHWGSYNESVFEDFSSTTTIDTTTNTVDLGINHDGYYFVGVDYLAPNAEETKYVGDGVSTLTKADGAWKIGDITVENGSDIYVNYASKESSSYTPPETDIPDDYPSPETEKTVTKNADGTYTIQLDVEGHQSETITQTAANVIVIMDITQSMTNQMPDGGGSRMAAAKSALTTLLDTLEPSTNKIYFTAVNFGNSANYTNGVNWTDQESAMRSYVSDLPNSPNDLGTCWQAGLQGGIDRAGTAPEGNETYILFVTDGNPNGWVNNQGIYQQQGSGQFVQQAYNAAQPNATTLAGMGHFYGIFVGDADGYNHLNDLVTYAGGEQTINGRTTSDIESAFGTIAETIVNNLGAGSVTVDDGIPSLSNVSANVTAGEAGGFEYYITPKNGTQEEWEEAPGASYDESNGVTWNLSQWTTR